jgi:hypothetical protein
MIGLKQSRGLGEKFRLNCLEAAVRYDRKALALRMFAIIEATVHPPKPLMVADKTGERQ